tara:strand:+ start:2366 stop:2764 length:399 start_codon:yes stop_codon:yes gene_type:complete
VSFQKSKKLKSRKKKPIDQMSDPVESFKRYQKHWLWVAFICIWLVFVSGVFGEKGRSPGLLQAFRLKSLLKNKKRELASLEDQVKELSVRVDKLTKDPVTQQKVIREVLGYAAEDEIVFDFHENSLRTLHRQ